MRLAILDKGHRVRTKGLFAVIRAISRLPAPDAVKTNRYRPDFYGMPMGVLTQKAMRGPFAWSVGDREMMGACVSQINECQVCTKTHGGVLAVAFVFNTVDRLSRTFGWVVAGPRAFAAGAKFLLARGYR